jgi:hypothetical protein
MVGIHNSNKHLNKQTGILKAMAFHPTEQILATASEDNTIKL